jgi:electron transfer flavoprotein alpha subunit
MTKDICVFVECKNGTIRKVSLEILSKAKEVGEKFSSLVNAVVIGSEIKKIAEELGSFADRVILVDSPDFKEYRWDTYCGALEHVIRKYAPRLIFGASTLTGKDLFPRLAARLNTAIIADAVGIDYDGEQILIRKPFFGGRILSRMSFSPETAPVITFRPNSFPIVNRSGKGEIVEEQPPIKKDPRLNIVSVTSSGSNKVDLQEAEFIICGGRGVKGPENFQVLEEIAGIMEGRVGASRAAVDSKWRPYEDQVGKSGKTVAPKVYIACGISGAVHHTMGMDTSKTIVAINKDPNAPIFQYADYGIVDDLFEVLPALKEELIKNKEENR